MYRVIIADDEPKVALLIKSLIHWDELGLELVATAHDGISALAMVEEHQPDIVITDIRMPGYDGIELIDRAKRLNPDIDFIIISGYRHFDYAQKAIRFGVEDYLLKPLKAVEINQTLRKMLEKYGQRDQAKQREESYSARVESDVKRLHEQFMAGLVNAEKGEGPTSLDQINRDFNLDFRADSFQAFVVKADVHFESLNANVRKLLMEKSTAVIREALVGKCHACLLYPTDRGIYGIVNFGDTQQKALRRAMVAVIDELQSQGELFDRIKVTVGVGCQTDDINELFVSVREAECAVANRLVYGPGRVIDRAGSQETAEIVRQIITANVRNRLLKSVEILDEPEIRSVIAGIADTTASLEGMTGKAIGAICDECIQILRFGLKSQNAVDDWVEERQGDCFEKLDTCNSQKDVFLLLSAYASDLVAHVVTLRKSENNKPIREAQKYMHAHFNHPISLESVSQFVGFNPTYFSQLFKKETGMNFLEYLIDVRIKEAKRMLSDPAKSIADVAADVGYSDVKHFSKLFARITGIQPSKYRKLYY